MIVLKHLTVERFRLLREINLQFPQRGSILIQGPNEAGKSTLFESIYFALYGEAIMLDRGKSTLDDLILYGEPDALVTLVLTAAETELTVTRSIQRGQGQHVTVRVRQADLPTEEVITDLGEANARIIAELGGIDSEALRNSCLFEQKGLNRLENLSGQQREDALRKVLGLEKLLTLADQFSVTSADEDSLRQSAQRLQLVELQQRVLALKETLAQLETALDAVSISTDLAEIKWQEEEIAGQAQLLTQLQDRRAELRKNQVRVQQLKRAEHTLDDIIAAYDAIGEAQRELPQLERDTAELDRRERTELPTLEQRVYDLVDLTHSFSTLERMSNDLLFSVNAIKELEHELKQQQALQEQSDNLDEQIIHARIQVDRVRHDVSELENRVRTERPQLEARLKRLRRLAERTITLYLAEEQFAQRLKQQRLAQDNRALAEKTQEELQRSSQELANLAEQEQHVREQANALQRQLNQYQLRHQLEEWQRLQKVSQELANAEQQVKAAHQRQEQLNLALMTASRTTMLWLTGNIVAALLAIAIGVLIFSLGTQHASVLVLIALSSLVLLFLLGAGYAFYVYSIAKRKKQAAAQQVQEAINQVGSMVAARAAVAGIGNNREALERCEHEIRSLGGTVPGSLEEAQQLFQQLALSSESPPELQQRMAEQFAALEAARQQSESAREQVEKLRAELNRLEQEYASQRWGEIEAKLLADKDSMKQKQQEISSLAGQEGLPIPNLDTSITQPIVSNAQLEVLVTEAIAATEQEIAALDQQLSRSPGLAAETKARQDALAALLAQKKALEEQQEHFRKRKLEQQLERAREQQQTLSSALQALQDSLRQRVKSLDVSFGQAAISNAEMLARKQLEALQIGLGGRVGLQSRRVHYLALLKERQAALSDYYHQLTKLSGALGNWIVPLNPFTDTLVELRARCRDEIQEANESSIEQELAELQEQESAIIVGIDLCHHAIAPLHERIVSMLVQHDRPLPQSKTEPDILAAWPLIQSYSPQDRAHLEDERTAHVQALSQLEQQELELSTQLDIGSEKLDLDQERAHLEQQQRNYQTKKYGNLLIKAVNERMMQKMLPRIEYYMQQILPLLTHGRYHEVQLVAEEGGEGALEARVWDSAAGAYVSKSRLSGGSADQLSLALRLAFVIAALPVESAAVPGFLLMDEPLSSFDRERTQALVDVLRSDIVSQHFEQVLFISHVNVFDTAILPYSIYMEGGRIIESNLFTLAAPPETPATPDSDDAAGAQSHPIPAQVMAES